MPQSLNAFSVCCPEQQRTAGGSVPQGKEQCHIEEAQEPWDGYLWNRRLVGVKRLRSEPVHIIYIGNGIAGPEALTLLLSQIPLLSWRNWGQRRRQWVAPGQTISRPYWDLHLKLQSLKLYSWNVINLIPVYFPSSPDLPGCHRPPIQIHESIRFLLALPHISTFLPLTTHPCRLTEHPSDPWCTTASAKRNWSVQVLGQAVLWLS